MVCDWLGEGGDAVSVQDMIEGWNLFVDGY